MSTRAGSDEDAEEDADHNAAVERAVAAYESGDAIASRCRSSTAGGSGREAARDKYRQRKALLTFEQQYKMGAKVESMKGWREAISKTTGATFAARITPKRQRSVAQLEAVREEIRIMRCLKSRYVLSLVADFEDDERIIVVTELLPGGGLFNRIVTREFFGAGRGVRAKCWLLWSLCTGMELSIVAFSRRISVLATSETDSDDGWSMMTTTTTKPAAFHTQN